MIISVLLNAAFLYVFTWLLVVHDYKVPEKSAISVLLVNTAKLPSQAVIQKEPQPEFKPNKIVDKKVETVKSAPQKKQPPKKQVVQNTEKAIPEIKPEPVRKNEEQPEIDQLSMVNNSELKEEQRTEIYPLLEEKPIEQTVNVMPLFRLTRMPKIMEYDLEGYYPKEELDFGREAIVLASVLLDANGDVLEVDIIESAGNRFDEAAKDALFAKKIKIQPGFVGDEPVASRVRIPVKFEINR